MRTKIALLSAALVAAGVASSMAQSNVYSLNVVGYVNINVTPGYNLISLPLQSADATSSINSVLTNTTPVTPGSTAVYTWDPTHSKFNNALYAGGDGNWYLQDGVTLATNGLPPGQAFFLQFLTPAQQLGSGDGPTTYTSETITVVGTVLQGSNSYPVTAGYNFYGNFEPVAGDITTNGFPVVDNSTVQTWNGAGYNNAVYGLGINDSAPDLSGNPGTVPLFVDQNGTSIQIVAPAVGAGFLYHYLGTSTSWTQNFTVQ
jgi:hypothetical protein